MCDGHLADQSGDIIMADGLVRFCEDLEVDPSDMVVVRAASHCLGPFF